jgi:type IV secretion system protein VirB3
MSEGLRRIPIHRSLTRPQLLAGCDRELLIFSGLLCGLLIFPAGLFRGDLLNVALGIFFMCAAITGLAKMAKTDPSMKQVYMRSLKYTSRYSGRPRYVSGKMAPPVRKRWD